MRIGFTGTQKAITDAQEVALENLLNLLDVTEAHHGDCIGADTAFHKLSLNHLIPIYIHPPVNSSKRGFNKNATILPEKEYAARNKDIVDSVDELIVCPESHVEKTRSGTWSTARYAKKQKKHIYIILPNGDIKHVDYLK